MHPPRKLDRRELLRTTVGAAAAAASLTTALDAEQAAPASPPLFPGFKSEKVQTSGATINVVSGGQGPPLLLLHGAPQTHATWHRVAPRLAKDYTVIAADLRGYGDSSKPPDGDKHANYSKRAMAQDQVEVMKHFGFDKFALVGHDRGGRVSHRLMLDHPASVTRAAVIDIVPTHKIFHTVSKEFATAYYHWFFLIQPAPFPETLLNNSIDFYMGRGISEAHAEYLRCFKDPANVHGMCEDYRAAATIDLDHDDADLNRKIDTPLLVLWSGRGPMGRIFDVLATWKERASNVTGKALNGGHSLQEEKPDETLAELLPFLKS